MYERGNLAQERFFQVFKEIYESLYEAHTPDKG